MMMHLSDVLYSFRFFLLFALLLGLLGFVVLTLLNRNLSLSSKRLELYGLFFDLKPSGQHFISLSLIRFLFLAYCAVFAVEMGRAHGLFLLAVTLLLFILHRSFKMLATELVYCALLYGALSVETVLKAYQVQVRFELSVALIFILFSAFILLYAASMLVKSIRWLAVSREGARFYDEIGREN